MHNRPPGGCKVSRSFFKGDRSLNDRRLSNRRLSDRRLSEAEACPGNTTKSDNLKRSMPHMYMLECADGSYETDSTKNLEQRLWQHQNGLGAKHTAKRLPVTLVYCEFFEHVTDAFHREKQVQGWSRKKKQALMTGDTNSLHQWAECQNESHYKLAGFGFAQPAADQCFMAKDQCSLAEDSCSLSEN